jgi:glycosyltransferase involved in cell wall biosynthesis
VRRELGIPPEAPVIGLMARFDPQKDHRTFIGAARILAESGADGAAGGGRTSPQAGLLARAPRFVICGENVGWDNPAYRRLIGEGPDGPFGSLFRLLGRRHDLRRLYNSFDLSGTSSLGEGFPNVVGEAMACAVPCVVTDVGDSALIVGNTGVVVPPTDPSALAAGWRKLLGLPPGERARLGRSARERIEREYGIGAVADRYLDLYERVFRRRYGR